MTICYAIFGTAEASDALIRASMTELLDTHRQFRPDEDFTLTVHGKSETLTTVREWAEINEIAAPNTNSAVEAVDAAWFLAKSGARVLALIGDDEPTGDVARALSRANKHSLEIRDLAEAGITYVYQEGEPPNTEEEMPKAPVEEPVEEEEGENLSWEEIGAIADDPDNDQNEDAQALITQGFEESDLDISDYDEATWSEAAAALQALEDEDGQNDEAHNVAPDPEPDDEEPVGFHPDDFKGKGLKDVRDLAKQSGIPNYAKLGRPELINALCGINKPEEEEPVTEADLPEKDHSLPSGRNDYAEPTLNSADIAAIAEAVADVLVRRLTR